MKKFKIPVTWSCYGTVEIEANSLEEAIEKAKDNIDDIALPTESEYVDGSFEINAEDIDFVEMLNGE